MDVNEEISALIETLLAAERRLEELTAGEVDTVTGRDGRTFLLGRAQEQLRHSETGKQTAILNALPAHIALLDTQGTIISVNESWRRFAGANGFHAAEYAVGFNYLDVCDRVRGEHSSEAHQVAAGIRAVLSGAEKCFSSEYPCHSPTEQRWFLLTVTPLADDHPNGAVVMHVNITARKLAADALEELSKKTERRERILNSALSSMSDFAQIYDREGRLLFANQPLLNLWGLKLETVVGKNFFDLGYPNELAVKLQRQVQGVFEHKQSITDETTYVSPAGLEGRYEYIFSPVCAGDGTVDFVVGSTREITRRKQTEEALRESEERLRAALSASCTGTFRWDIRSNELSWDESLDALFGLHHARGVRSLETFIASVHPDDRSGVIERCERCAREGADFSMEFRVVWPDGSLHWLDDRGKTFLDISGQPLYMTGACVDVTERKRAEEASRHSEEKFREVADNITDVFWIMSHDMHEMLYVSKAYEALWGFSMQSLYANPHQWLNAILPEDRERVLIAFSGLTKDVPAVNVEYRIIRPDGTVRWIHDRGFQVRDATGRLVRNAGLATDITERKEVADALQYSRKRLRDIIDGMGPSMFVGLLTPDGVLVEVNQSPLTAAGLKAEDVLGKSFDKTPWWSHSPEAQQRLREAIARAALGEASRYDVRTHGADGQVIDIDFSLQPLRDETGQIVFLIPSASVITERKIAEAALRASEAEFRALAEAMPQMVWVTRPDGWTTYFSQQWMDYTGLTLEESLGYGWNKPFHPEDRQRAWDAWQNATTTNCTYSVECRLRRVDGVYRWWLIRGVLIREVSGNILKWFGTCTDIHDLKLAEQTLRESEERFSGAFLHAPIGVALVSPDGHWLQVNRVFCDQVGYSEAELLTRTFRDITHPEDLDDELDNVRELVAGVIQSYQTEKRYIHARGHLVSVLLNVSLVRDSQGRPRYLIAQMQDITEQKRASALLVESQQRLTLATESAHIGIWDWDVVTNKLVWDDQMYALYGIREEDFSGAYNTWQRGVHPDDRARSEAELTAAVHGVDGFHTEFRVLWPNGEVRHIEAHALARHAGDGSTAHMIGVNWDITARKRAEESLRLLGSAVEQSKESITITDAKTDLPGPKIIFVNPAFTQMTGYTSDEAIGKTLQILQGPRTDRAVMNELLKNPGNAEGVAGETINYRKDGTEFNLEWQIAPIRNSGGQVTHFVAIQRDITVRKRDELRLQALHTELLDTSRRAGMAEVATGVLHNVGNVLNSVNVSTSIALGRLRKLPVSRLTDVVRLLADHAGDLSEYLTVDRRGRFLPAFLAELSVQLNRETLEIASEMSGLAENVEHIKQIVNTQQRYAGNFGVLEPLNLSDAIEDALRIHSGVLKSDGVEIVRQLEPVSAVAVDKHKLLQILINVIGNAKGAMTDSHTKVLTVKTSSSSDGSIQVSVRDTGCGIVAENITRIFSHGFTTKKDGHGFGLHSSALAAKEMNASLIAQSDGTGLGAVFTLVFPHLIRGQPAA